MTDTVSRAERSRIMSSVRHESTAPELTVRSLLHKTGYRFRLHRRDLPGTPDIVLPKYKAVIFVHGCFWHRHPGCRRSALPRTRREYWIAKFARNVDRDEENRSALTRLGWRVLVVWECEVKETERLTAVLEDFLSSEED